LRSATVSAFHKWKVFLLFVLGLFFLEGDCEEYTVPAPDPDEDAEGFEQGEVDEQEEQRRSKKAKVDAARLRKAHASDRTRAVDLGVSLRVVIQSLLLLIQLIWTRSEWSSTAEADTTRSGSVSRIGLASISAEEPVVLGISWIVKAIG